MRVHRQDTVGGRIVKGKRGPLDTDAIPRTMLTIGQCVRLTGKSRRTLERWRQSGRLQVCDNAPNKTTGLCLIRALQAKK